VDRQNDPGRWILESPLVPTPLARLEAEATSFVSAELVVMPGLVQTAEYAREMMKAGDAPPELIEGWVDLRMERQLILAKNNPPKFDIIVDEIALRRVIGSHAVMARQLRALLEAADRPNMRLWVVPAETGGLAGFDSSFYILNFPRDESVVQLETKTSIVYIEDKEKIDIFRRHAAKLGKAALDPARSVDFVAAIAREHERE